MMGVTGRGCKELGPTAKVGTGRDWVLRNLPCSGKSVLYHVPIPYRSNVKVLGQP
jgi:hypothetical protein